MLYQARKQIIVDQKLPVPLEIFAVFKFLDQDAIDRLNILKEKLDSHQLDDLSKNSKIKVEDIVFALNYYYSWRDEISAIGNHDYKINQPGPEGSFTIDFNT